MEITLEKIELVKDRTGVSYKEAKEALIKTDGNVVDAIIYIEDGIDVAPGTKAESTASRIVEDLKEVVKKGNVTKILVKKDDEVILNLPVTIGILGVVFVPWAALISAIAALGLSCSISIVKNDGEVVDIMEKATAKFNDVKESHPDLAEGIKEKRDAAVSKVKETAEAVKTKVSSVDFFNDDDDDYFNFDDDYPDLDEEPAEPEITVEDIIEAAGEEPAPAEEEITEEELEDSFEDALAGFRNRVSEIAEENENNMDSIISELIDDDDFEEDSSELDALLEEAARAGAEAEDLLKEAEEAIEETAEEAAEVSEEQFDSAVSDIKEKKKRFRFFS